MDVGNIISDHGASTGVKQWTESDLRRDDDYFYDAHSRQVKLRSSVKCDTSKAAPVRTSSAPVAGHSKVSSSSFTAWRASGP